MCGIAGAASRDAGFDVGPIVTRLTAALAHRGPDGEGFHFARGRSAGLGNRRLSIVDLPGGAQPIASEDERVWVTYNGEIYNHLDLRRELIALGHRFRTNADTEVLVHGFEAWGADLFGRLNGIFAFALLDGRSEPGELWLVRDPAGVKPLYVGWAGDTWWFASELAAARSCGVVEAELRPGAIDEYLVYRFIPSPGTPYRHAWKVPPGHAVRLPLARLPTEPAFEAFEARFAPATTPRSADEWMEALRGGIRAAVRRQLMADVPVGSLLSGGVDSTIVTGLMKDGLPQPPRAFAVGFGGDGDTGELRMARHAAAELGVPLREVQVSEADYLQAWLDQVAALGEPIANTSILLVGLLCRAVRETHKVVLTGQGADEPLGGYPRHAAERLFPFARLARPLLRLLPERVAESDRLARMRRVVGERDRARRFAEIIAVFSPREATALTGHGIDAEQLAAPAQRWLVPSDDGDSLNALLRVDARLSLADDLLIVADHMSMAASVELRVPFLDLELLALIERMPSRYKVSVLGERKWLYRRAARDLLPPSLRASLLGWRARTGRKLGFTTPVDQWFARWMTHDADEFLTGPSAVLPQVTRGGGAGVGRYLAEVRRRGLVRPRQVMALFVLESWLRARG